MIPDSILKTQIPGDPDTSYEPIVIPALTHLVDHTDTESLLCPLRSQQTNLLKTATIRPRCHRLFMSYTDPYPKTLSVFWIMTAIKEAYKDVPQSDLQWWKVSAHEVRAVATSLLFRQNASICDVTNTTSWRSRLQTHVCVLLSERSEP